MREPRHQRARQTSDRARVPARVEPLHRTSHLFNAVQRIDATTSLAPKGTLHMLQLRLCHMADAHRATNYDKQAYVPSARVTPRKGVTPLRSARPQRLQGTPRRPPVRLLPIRIDI